VALPRLRTRRQIVTDTAAARAEFRNRRLVAPLTEYQSTFPAAKAAADEVIRSLRRIVTVPADKDFIAGLVADKRKFAALRNLAGTPISADDLDTLLERTITQTALRANQDLANSLARLLGKCLDPHRFPWMAARRKPSATELAAASLATAVLTAVSAVLAARRGIERDELEGKVLGILGNVGFTRVKKPKDGIRSPAQFPQPGTFMRGCTFGGHNADFVIRLRDERVLALECKASNSKVNGIKRLVKEVGVDAGDWYRRFGKDSVVVAAALRGVFNTDDVAKVQSEHVYIFWWHRMADLQEFLVAARQTARST
jgi:XamI restriction endonuclease